MIDLETLSTRTDAAIIQIGAVFFDPRDRGRVFNDKAFNTYIKVQDGGGAIDNGTLGWWLQQPHAPEVGKALWNDETPMLGLALEGLTQFPTKDHANIPGLESWQDVGGIWSKGPSFDMAILKSAFAKFGAETPWDFRRERDCRTVIALAGADACRPDSLGLQAHDAVDDCVYQIMEVQKALSILGKSL
ncbi:hypothetical protein P67b_00041 [Ruegeria phage Tedan]|nr:hypothetical protein P67b_00041 [Ruegeria phage Tedan]